MFQKKCLFLGFYLCQDSVRIFLRCQHPSYYHIPQVENIKMYALGRVIQSAEISLVFLLTKLLLLTVHGCFGKCTWTKSARRVAWGNHYCYIFQLSGSQKGLKKTWRQSLIKWRLSLNTDKLKIQPSSVSIQRKLGVFFLFQRYLKKFNQ